MNATVASNAPTAAELFERGVRANLLTRVSEATPEVRDAVVAELQAIGKRPGLTNIQSWNRAMCVLRKWLPEVAREFDPMLDEIKRLDKKEQL